MEHHFFGQRLQSLAIHAFGLHLRKDGFEVWLLDLSNADFVERDDEVVHGAFGEDGVVSIIWVLLYETAHPLCKGESLTRDCFVKEIADAEDDFLDID
jgi:hypothetical protein